MPSRRRPARAFDGYTIPTRVRGGWWYGTERYDPAGASLLRVLDARVPG